MDNKSLMVSKKGFFYKVKKFFRSIFNKDNIQEKTDNGYNKIENETMRKISFNEDIKIKPDVEREQLLKMQRDYENGLIREEEMSVEQVDGIEKLYIEQISKLRDDYNMYKHKITGIRKKLAASNQ